jgi:hypothetical protein
MVPGRVGFEVIWNFCIRNRIDQSFNDLFHRAARGRQRTGGVILTGLALY